MINIHNLEYRTNKIVEYNTRIAELNKQIAYIEETMHDLVNDKATAELAIGLSNNRTDKINASIAQAKSEIPWHNYTNQTEHRVFEMLFIPTKLHGKILQITHEEYIKEREFIVKQIQKLFNVGPKNKAKDLRK